MSAATKMIIFLVTIIIAGICLYQGDRSNVSVEYSRNMNIAGIVLLIGAALFALYGFLTQETRPRDRDSY